MSPKILVAVDIVEDQVVRLKRGELKERTVYGDEPLEIALDWERKGADWLHVVDLDGATKGEQENSKAIEAILSSVKIPVQVGGGVRTLEGIDQWLRLGAQRVVLGTKAVEPDFLAEAVGRFGESVVAAVDARDGVVHVGGWQRTSGQKTLEILTRIVDSGVSRVMFTDIERDGMLEGPDYDEIREVLDNVSLPIIVSGGISTVHDIAKLAKLGAGRIEGLIIGRALYQGNVDIAEAKAALSD